MHVSIPCHHPLHQTACITRSDGSMHSTASCHRQTSLHHQDSDIRCKCSPHWTWHQRRNRDSRPADRNKCLLICLRLHASFLPLDLALRFYNHFLPPFSGPRLWLPGLTAPGLDGTRDHDRVHGTVAGRHDLILRLFSGAERCADGT